MNELVSVIIPTYNRFRSLNLSIQSVLNQTYENFEIIVINDRSIEEDYYKGELEKYPKTTVLHLPENLKKVYNVNAAQGKTREEGMKIARGQWYAFLDDDDYWSPQKLEKQFEMLSLYPEIKMCSTNMYMIHGSYSPDIKTTLYHLDVKHKTFSYDLIVKFNLINNSTVLIHRTICDKVGSFALGINEDWDYWKRALKFTDCCYVKEPLVYYNTGGIRYYS